MGHMYEQKLIVIFFKSRISFLIPSVHRQNGFLLFFFFPISYFKNMKEKEPCKLNLSHFISVFIHWGFKGLDGCTFYTRQEEPVIHTRHRTCPNALWLRAQIYQYSFRSVRVQALAPSPCEKSPDVWRHLFIGWLTQHWVSAQGYAHSLDAL